jgi:hypothetical protein
MAANNHPKCSKYSVKSNDDLWDITLVHSGEVANKEDTIWIYEFWRRDNLVYRGTITGQYNEEPDLDEIMVELSGHLNRVMIQFTKYGEKQ